jgi:hypothetical protein
VYLWLRGNVPLYVGMSRRGIYRLGPRHHRLAPEETDEILVWPMADVKQARAIELLFIRTLQPYYNHCDKRDYQDLSARTGMSIGHLRGRARQLRRRRGLG